ncbi:ATP-binding protein [Streptomyces camelliae]|uniref:ATP-binding protein n=1 Tax=Streptomyces camelliae TaxID=3004093 RepID=A0ABY7P098_9ACTN|nr:ATP-binding protein [Streptomyces sp. HUAS 2-6]WBO63921.1 ATP-binding protein [Streptomyces sp. HUAS 2-6]
MPSTPPGKPGTLALTPAPAPNADVERRRKLFDRRRTTPGAARRFVAETLTQWGRTERLDDVQLCVSELATNAILHGAPSGGLVLVHVTLADTQLRIEVHDSGNAPPHRRHVPGHRRVVGHGPDRRHCLLPPAGAPATPQPPRDADPHRATHADHR